MQLVRERDRGGRGREGKRYGEGARKEAILARGLCGGVWPMTILYLFFRNILSFSNVYKILFVSLKVFKIY